MGVGVSVAVAVAVKVGVDVDVGLGVNVLVGVLVEVGKKRARGLEKEQLISRKKTMDKNIGISGFNFLSWGGNLD
jgi:hypothetical protein